ncbi:hypothetical protein ASPWEDRAFT_182996 [Aspergillus wentii DTO 134E9]|uniref:DUF7702 domain-containing protein n=1 Tax=Aspergillus wentii DTO 134E9 TaxID=1073089 RepID=A0A1L9RIV4_ASPWE|nr:uncharacterized protein ASPWEDRAFT_182996 [Aspergillus wentii DTO 134E9]OJJ34859.1 hypothetical protein ASPWEDRAFT_182996 [Aspergillus wentii DTO 134E9]
MGLSYSHGISVLELIIYLPSFFLAAFLVFRHGLKTNAGALFLVIFTLVRIIGACCDLATISHASTGLYQATAICSSIGLSPLIMACSGLLSRANESIKRKGGSPINEVFFTALRILTIVGLILCIVALSRGLTVESLQHPDVKIKIGMILFLVAWAMLCFLLAILTLHRSQIEKGEHRLLLAVAISAVLILVRLIYSMLAWFLANSTFNILNGNMTVQLVMSVLEEFGVVIVCIAVGLTLRVGAPIEEEKIQHAPLAPEGPGYWRNNVTLEAQRY